MRVLIIGGTSGIGWALAEHYLRAGHEVHVCGRDISRLSIDVTRQYPALCPIALDIADKPGLAAMIDGLGDKALDLLIVTAGFYFNNRHHKLDAATTLRMLQTNVSGLVHAFELASQKMLKQKSGHLVAISSVAGLLKDYPGASLYSASKRSVLSLCETYRTALADFSIPVTAIVPGYVDTAKLRALNGGDASSKPFIMSEQKAVAYIVEAIDKRVAVSVFPWQMRWLIKLLNYLPSMLLRLRS